MLRPNANPSAPKKQARTGQPAGIKKPPKVTAGKLQKKIAKLTQHLSGLNEQMTTLASQKKTKRAKKQQPAKRQPYEQVEQTQFEHEPEPAPAPQKQQRPYAQKNPPSRVVAGNQGSAKAAAPKATQRSVVRKKPVQQEQPEENYQEQQEAVDSFDADDISDKDLLAFYKSIKRQQQR